MGRRSRQRPHAATPTPGVAPEPPRAPRVSSRGEEAPKAPWHPFPLVELAVLAGMVLLVTGFAVGGDARPVLIFGGLALVSVAALELAIREHFAGYRSHSGLLAAVTGFGVAVPLWWTPIPQEAIVVAFAVVAAAAFRSLRGAFARRSGGLAWRA